MATLNYKDKKVQGAIQEIISCAEELRQLREIGRTRTKNIQSLAAMARRTGTPQTEALKKIDRDLVVIDYGNAINGICDALDKIEKIK